MFSKDIDNEMAIINDLESNYHVQILNMFGDVSFSELYSIYEDIKNIENTEMREKIYNKITNFIADILNSPLDYDILITDDILMLFSIELMKYIDNNDFDFNIVKKIFDGLVRNHNTDILYKLKYIFLDIITNFEPHLIFDKL